MTDRVRLNPLDSTWSFGDLSQGDALEINSTFSEHSLKSPDTEAEIRSKVFGTKIFFKNPENKEFTLNIDLDQEILQQENWESNLGPIEINTFGSTSN